jgi:hypothetical protein
MQRLLLGSTLTIAPVGMAVALLAMGYSAQDSAWWQASVVLAILGAITIMIYGINIHSVPAHSGRAWASDTLVATQVVSGVVGAWLAFLGRGLGVDSLDRVGFLLALIGAILFMTNLGLLFRQPGPARPPKVPAADRTVQQRVDRLAIPFTILSGLMVVGGTALGLVLTFWTPGFGRWDLVWAHVMLLGFFFSMASGTSYHMLSRWTGRSWRFPNFVRAHLVAFLASFPLMIVALAWDIDALFLIAGPLMAIAMIAWAANVVPMSLHLSGPVRAGILLALLFLVAGVSMGVIFAVDPATGPRLRWTHVAANLYGFAGLLISGFGYAYLLRLSGTTSLRWPRLAVTQLGVMVSGVAAAMITMALRMYGHIGHEPVLLANGIAAAGMLLFAIQVAGTFMQGRQVSRSVPQAVHASSAG